jgi:hypothetical protein
VIYYEYGYFIWFEKGLSISYRPHNSDRDTRIYRGCFDHVPLFLRSAQPAPQHPTTPNGADAAGSAFKNESFWKTVLGFGATEWNFGGVARGYPVLRNVVNAGEQ